ncbi:hypothetical protein [Marilutibacter spongiae]|uniref:Uncharacterized protein n=1 Tax=Marilutibacter spongiae TaxID=2025720 RepID=A0A7W3Y528_9GAMM|nr:hypothetical protein [Lysobacter spongiae]MBB1059564.1 hypothetical protein [Lysobacter spongiae]
MTQNFLVGMAIAAIFGYVVGILSLRSAPTIEKRRFMSTLIGTAALSFFMTSLAYELGWLVP